MKKTKPEAMAGVLPRRGLLSQRKKETMLAVLLRNEEVFAQLVPQLHVRDVRSVSDAHAAVYRAALAFHQAHGCLPNKPQLKDQCQQLIDDFPVQLSHAECSAMEAFVDLVFDKKEWGKKDLASDATYAAFAIASFKQFREEVLAVELQSKFDGARVPVDLAGCIRNVLQKVDEVKSLDIGPAKPIFGPGWRQRQRAAVAPTGLSVFDSFTGGGLRKKESLLFMAPYGSCKTVISVMGLVEGAKLSQMMTNAPDNVEGHIYKSVLASYEMPLEELQERCLAYLARVPRSRLEEIGDMDDPEKGLRTGTELLPYEKKAFRRDLAKNVNIPTELQRVEAAEELLNKHAVFIDMTGGNADEPERGSGGVQELAAVLRAEQRHDPKLVFEYVWIDHLAAMIEQQLGAIEVMNLGESTRRYLIRQSALQITKLIAKRFDVPVVVLHQLSGDANSRGPVAKVHHTDGDECRTVGMPFDFAIVSGSPTEDNERLCVFDMSKHRRRPPRQRQIVRVRGDFNQITNVSNKYTVDYNTRRIVTVEEAESVVKPTHKKPKKNSVDGIMG